MTKHFANKTKNTMMFKTLTLDFRKVNNVKKLYHELDLLFGFPDFYGHNADATIDCLSSLPFPDEQMCAVHLAPAEHLLLQTMGLTAAPEKVRQIFLGIVEAVNQRWEEIGIDHQIYLQMISPAPKGF